MWGKKSWRLITIISDRSVRLRKYNIHLDYIFIITVEVYLWKVAFSITPSNTFSITKHTYWDDSWISAASTGNLNLKGIRCNMSFNEAWYGRVSSELHGHWVRSDEACRVNTDHDMGRGDAFSITLITHRHAHNHFQSRLIRPSLPLQDILNINMCEPFYTLLYVEILVIQSKLSGIDTYSYVDFDDFFLFFSMRKIHILIFAALWKTIAVCEAEISSCD